MLRKRRQERPAWLSSLVHQMHSTEQKKHESQALPSWESVNDSLWDENTEEEETSSSHVFSSTVSLLFQRRHGVYREEEKDRDYRRQKSEDNSREITRITRDGIVSSQDRERERDPESCWWWSRQRSSWEWEWIATPMPSLDLPPFLAILRLYLL